MFLFLLSVFSIGSFLETRGLKIVWSILYRPV